jgi:hypothetical protein
MDAHAHMDQCLPQIFSLQINLRFHRSVHRIPSGVECRAKTIPNDLKYITIVGFNCIPQNGMMSGAQRFPFFWMFLCQFLLFNIGV